MISKCEHGNKRQKCARCGLRGSQTSKPSTVTPMKRRFIPILVAFCFTACDTGEVDELEFREADPLCQTEAEYRPQPTDGETAPPGAWTGCHCTDLATQAGYMTSCPNGTGCAVCCGKTGGAHGAPPPL